MNSIKKIQEYISLISREPEPEMIKQGDGYSYIPKVILQRELLVIYGGSDSFEMIRESLTSKGAYGVGRLTLKHPVTGDWIVKSGEAYIEYSKPMKLDFPSLSAHCFTNACKKIGPWFGQTLNPNEDEVSPVKSEKNNSVEVDSDIEGWLDKIKKAKTINDVNQILESAGSYKLPLQHRAKDIIQKLKNK